MGTLKELRDERLRKLEDLKTLGVNPYPAQSERTHDNTSVHANFVELEGKPVTVVGRITSIRKFGKIAFVVIRDDGSELQLIWRFDETVKADRSNSELLLEDIPLLDTGDFVQARGKVIKSQTGEESVEVESLRLLTKSLRPMPTTHDGFTNKEERLRRRYVDLNVNQDVFQRFIRRSKFWKATRDFFDQEGFIEINTPVLEQTTGGADANPFVTHMSALDQEFYLRISHELPLKRLLVGGFEKVYDIGPRFRNENYSDEHLPEHINMEWYWAYADWEKGMELTERNFRFLADRTWSTRQFKLANGMEVDLGPDGRHWQRLSFVDVILERYNIDVFESSLEECQTALKAIGAEVEKGDNRSRIIDKLWKKIRVELSGPVFLTDIPAFLQPLAKLQADNPKLTQQFNLVLGGSEVCKAYSELNDPIMQLDNFMEQQQMRDAGDDEAMMLDIDYVEALEYGMPPACGLGYGERLFWMLEGVTAREGVIFPLLRRETDGVTKGIYPEVFNTNSGQRKGVERPQDFSKRIVTVVNKELEPWRVANAVAHMEAIVGNKIPHDQLTSGDYFVGSDDIAIPRNSQYPIIIMKGSEKDLHKLHDKVRKEGLMHHVFIKEMQDTTNDAEIVESLQKQAIADTNFYGLSFFATNEQAEQLTKNFQLWQ